MVIFNNLGVGFNLIFEIHPSIFTAKIIARFELDEIISFADGHLLKYEGYGNKVNILLTSLGNYILIT